MAKGKKEKFGHSQEDRASIFFSQRKMFSEPRLIRMNKNHFPSRLGPQKTLLTYRNCSRE